MFDLARLDFTLSDMRSHWRAEGEKRRGPTCTLARLAAERKANWAERRWNREDESGRARMVQARAEGAGPGRQRRSQRERVGSGTRWAGGARSLSREPGTEAGRRDERTSR